MLNKLKRFIGSNEPVQHKSEEIEQQQYIQYAQELEQSLSRLEAGVHESDDPSWIMQSVMKTALDFYKGDWIGFLEVDLELGLWTPTHWYNPSPNDKTLDLLQEFESAEFLHRWVTAMHDNTAIVVPDMEEVREQFPGEYAVYQRLMAKSVLAVPVKPRPMGFLVIRNPQRYLTRSSLRAGFGMVLQETWLRSGTIRDNICMGKPDATEEEIIRAAKASHAHGFIKRLPNGYDTVITEDGGSLSQGQKQLLCITRVMLCLPPMLILDEATSSIDTRTEIKIQNAFATMMEGRTSFIVAHRLSTIQSADVILVMKDGNIIEQGNHETLLAQGGFYANLYNSQFAV